MSRKGPWVRILLPPPENLTLLDFTTWVCGEMAELAEGARLLSECRAKALPRVRIPLSPPKDIIFRFVACIRSFATLFQLSCQSLQLRDFSARLLSYRPLPSRFFAGHRPFLLLISLRVRKILALSGPSP